MFDDYKLVYALCRKSVLVNIPIMCRIYFAENRIGHLKGKSLSGENEFQNSNVETTACPVHFIVRLSERGDGAGNKIKMARALGFFHHDTKRRSAPD